MRKEYSLLYKHSIHLLQQKVKNDHYCDVARILRKVIHTVSIIVELRLYVKSPYSSVRNFNVLSDICHYPRPENLPLIASQYSLNPCWNMSSGSFL